MHQNGYLGMQIFTNFPEDNIIMLICQMELCDPPTFNVQLMPMLPSFSPPPKLFVSDTLNHKQVVIYTI